MKPLALLTLCLALAACGTSYVRTYANLDDPFYLKRLDPGTLDGRWFVTASFPAPFEEGCTHATTDIAALPDGRLSLVNRCRLGEVTKQYSGVADLAGNAVSRTGGTVFVRDYWVIDRSVDGRTLLIGTPTRIGGFMLHRDSRARPDEYDWAREVFAKSGYDIAALQRMNQR